MARFTERLRREAEPLWTAQFEHPFIRGIADGSLDPERFRHYIRQDYLFLIEYGRLLALTSARAPTLELQTRTAELTLDVLKSEMDLHRTFVAEWGVSTDELEAETMAPTTRAYTDFLLRTASLGDFTDLIAALLPCMWGYSDLGRRLAEDNPPDEPRYARWIEMYSSDEFGELAAWCRDVTDQVAGDVGNHRQELMLSAFLQSSRYELAFWEMAWRLERPV